LKAAPLRVPPNFPAANHLRAQARSLWASSASPIAGADRVVAGPSLSRFAQPRLRRDSVAAVERRTCRSERPVNRAGIGSGRCQPGREQQDARGQRC